MKKVIVAFLFLTASVHVVHSQTSIGVENDLKGLMATGGNVGNTVVSSFNTPEIKGKRYLFNTWTPGMIISTNGTVYSSNYSLNFDKINQDLYAIEENKTDKIFLLDKSKIQRFISGQLVFVNSNVLQGGEAGSFYQVLAEDSTKLSLYKLTTTRFVKSNPNDIMNARTGNFVNEYVDDAKYFISANNGELKRISLNEKNIRKALKEESDKVDKFFSSNSAREIDEVFLVDLIKYLE